MMTSLLAFGLVMQTLAAAPVPTRLAAEVEDAYALTSNPAGLFLVPRSELRLTYGLAPGLSGPASSPGHHGLGAYFATSSMDESGVGIGFGAGFSFDTRRSDEAQRHQINLGVALAGQSFGVGAGFDWLSPYQGDGQGRLNLGVYWHPSRWLGAAVAVKDTTENIGQRIWELSASFRPFTERVQLSTSLILDESQEFNSDTLDMRFMLKGEALRGLHLGVATNLEAEVFAQMQLELDWFSVGGAFQNIGGDEVGGLGEIVFRSPAASAIRTGKLLLMKLGKTLVPESEFNLLSLGYELNYFEEYISKIKQAQTLPDIKAAVVVLSRLSLSWARAQELRQALLDFKAGGADLYCYLGHPGNVEYYVATVCDNIAMPPSHSLNISGIATVYKHFKSTYDKLGLKAYIYRRKKYKSAPDRYIRAEPSPEEREAREALLDQFAAQQRQGFIQGKKLNPEEAQKLIEKGVYTADAAKAAGLVRHVLQPDEFSKKIALETGIGATVSLDTALQRERRPRRWHLAPRIAVVHVDGIIVEGRSRQTILGLGKYAGVDSIVAELERVRRDPEVKAVVLRVNSPGGSASASDLLAHAVKQLNQVKPVIASFGGVAASGGYYIAAPAKKIYALPSSITGSIGIYRVLLVREGFNEMIGMTTQTSTRGSYAAMGTPYRKPTAKEEQLMDSLIEAGYQRFLKVVSEGRGLTKDKVEEVAQGRVWSGKAAHERGLVDALGGFSEAVEAARVAAGLDPDLEYTLEHYPNESSVDLTTGLSLLGQARNPLQEFLQQWTGTLDLSVFFPVLMQRDFPPDALMALEPAGLSID